MVTRRGEIKLEGLLLAVLGFGITRFVVAESLQTDAAIPFLIAGLIPLVIGLGLTVFGVALAVGTFRQDYVRTVTIWAFAGTGAMALVLALTAVDAVLRGDAMGVSWGSGVFVANVLLGGTVGGAITGDRAAANRRNREEIERQVDRATMINRILRHEVLNGATIVQGYADVLKDRPEEKAVNTIQDAGARIESTVEEVGSIADDSAADLGAVDLRAIVTEEIEEFEQGAVEIDLPEEVFVRADDRLRIVVQELVENALSHGSSGEDSRGGAVRVSGEIGEGVVRLRVEDDGPGMPTRNRDLLESGTLPEYDDPMSGFGLQTVRLLVEHYDGEIAVEVEEGTAVSISLVHVSETGDPVSALGVEQANLAEISGASIVAGVVMGLYLQFIAGSLPVIGALYAVQSQTVGWVTHLFHSVVFGLLFAAGVTRPTLRTYDGVGQQILLGAGWGALLWLFAAGLLMPLWLQSVGIQAMTPNLTVPGLAGHIIWGAVLGGLYALLAR